MATITKENIDEVQMRIMHQRMERFSRVRLVFIPILAAALLMTLVGDHSFWRWGLLCGFALMVLVRIFQALRRKRGPCGKREPWSRSDRGSPLLAVLPMGGLLLATGGADSPMLPIVLLACFVIGTLAPSGGLAVSFSLTLAGLVVLLTLISGFGWIPHLMPALFGGGSHLDQPRALLVAKGFVYLLMLAWSAIAAGLVRKVFRQMLDEALDARDEVLRGNEAHARDLTVLSGELAHELKNPLANIKGLAVLVSRDVHGKGAERIEVLQHEITRMEETLQEFLTFSRPLSPLSQEKVDLPRLCQSVVSLHEGMAYARNVTLSVSAQEPVFASCDSRKVKQILINLVQNALEAAPSNSNVEIDLHKNDDGAVRIEIRDRGPGLSEDIRARLFQPGATTKERGTGLGLALARGLARQHGGDLSLDNRADGGCLATLMLPENKKSTSREVA
jgi:two-component system, NtrC family, sensor histidine kinase HydH